MRRSTMIVAGLATAGLIALGCSAGGAESGVTGDVGEAQNSGNAQNSAGKAKHNPPAEFGTQTKTLDNGVVVSTDTPKLFTPSSVAAGHQPGNKAWRVKITVENGADEPMGEYDLTIDGTMGKDGTTCDRVFDSGLTDFSGTIQPGKKQSATVGFSCPTTDTSVVGLQVKTGALARTVADFEGKPTS